ncbi:hypothetical protein BDQ17DRAFT_1049753 [Cyathus striatus]|nr:hypothetical protein BDQ17DRAFT_1049753 [Cyathus striatus]
METLEYTTVTGEPTQHIVCKYGQGTSLVLQRSVPTLFLCIHCNMNNMDIQPHASLPSPSDQSSPRIEGPIWTAEREVRRCQWSCAAQEMKPRIRMLLCYSNAIWHRTRCAVI